ncbi:MAG: surface layer protein B [Methanomicrobiales archaeon]|nr:surface layer protein B [Methanomicrobiales archaeon]NYT21199.1 surface layer protein B [Methanomicrobiales archaeon]
MQKHPVILVLTLLLLIAFIHPALSLTATSLVGDAANRGISPFNPDFISYTEERKKGFLDMSRFETTTLGYIPPTVDLSHTRGSQVVFAAPSYSGEYLATVSGSPSYPYTSSFVTGSSLPSRFDLRTQGKLTPVKDQGTCGSCWAFSTFASLESGLLPQETWDFSENNMKNTHGYDLASCQGGNALMATAYLTRGSGPLLEQNDPYKPIQVSSLTTTVPNTAAVKLIEEVLFIPGRSNAGDNQNIKQALMQYGAVYSTIHWEESYYASSSASYYYGGSSRGNHAVTIVGWDDTYDRSRFPYRAPGNGAFIVKNSWGSAWGEKGYFYVSYYDTSIGLDNAVFLSESTGDYEHIYQYDPLGWVTSYGEGGETAYFANIFTAQADEQIAAVGFYTPATNSQYKVSVYRNIRDAPVSGSPLGTTTGTISSPGYHTITLSEPVRVSRGEKFSVMVKLLTPGYRYPVAIEYPYSGFSSKASAHSGQSYVSSTGTLWTDISTVYANTNVCLKALSIPSGQTTTPSPTITPTPLPTVIPATTPSPTPVMTDIFPPSVSISSPRAYTTVSPGSSVGVAWSASDNTGVSKVSVEYSGDGGMSWTSAGTNLPASGSLTLIVPPVTGSTLGIRVTAWDASGNTRSATRTCFVRNTFSTSGIPAPTSPSPTPTIPSMDDTARAELLSGFLKQYGYA